MTLKSSILLTGGSGLLAVNWFYSKNNEFTVYLGLNERIINPNGSHVVIIDFSSEKNLTKQLEEIRPSVVVHTAGLTSVEKCEKNPELAYFINVELSIMVSNATKALNIPMVHISTDHLFEGDNQNLSESEPVNGINVYGKTKALAEKYVAEINPDSLIIRSNFYGWGPSYRKSFSDQIIKSLRNKQVINLFEDVYYTPILAENLIQTVHSLLVRGAKGTYNVVSDDRISKYDFGIMIAEEFLLDKSLIHRATLKHQTNLVKRPLDMSLSNQKVRELLGRNLGSVKQHIAQLHLQEHEAITKEIQLL
jgi:dTDP-4-dehydrorhamnose reductase